MKLAAVYFDDTVCIPGGKDVGGGLTRQDLRESCFQAADGWDIYEESPGRFRLWRDGMGLPAYVGGYGYTCLYEPPAKIAVERVQPWDAVGGMMREMTETGDVERMNAIADRLEEQGEAPMAAMKQAIDAVIGPEEPVPPPRKRRRK